MFRTDVEDSAAKVIATGALITTIMVGAWWGTDPVNVPKLFTLTITALCGLAIFLVGFDTLAIKRNKFLAFISVAFITMASISTILSTEPVLMSFYGVFGRNNGFLSYFAFALLFFLVAQFKKIESLKKLVRAFYLASLLNVFYCALSIAGIELIPWNNIFNTILGTFGNPNFIGAFLGMFASYLFGSFFEKSFHPAGKVFNFFIFILTWYQIVYSNAIQGIVVGFLGCAVVLFYVLRAKFQSRIILTLYSLAFLMTSVISALGALQIGPLTNLIYKTSVSLRGEYWQAGINMGLNHPLFGIGMDSYGAWYRQLREESAIILPGPDTTTNAAHNVVIDIFASGGFPLLLTYLCIQGLTILSVLKVMNKKREFDFTFVSLVAVWVGFQAQSIISINQIGIAIWGWVFGGAIIAYERMNEAERSHNFESSERKSSPSKKKTSSKQSDPSTVIAAFAGAVVGGLIALPPLSADINWRSALGSGSQEQLERSVVQFPTTPNRLAEGVQIFSQNNLPDVARKYALILIGRYPNNFISWGAYAQLTDLTDDEKQLILDNLRRLDPLNPKFKTNEQL